MDPMDKVQRLQVAHHPKPQRDPLDQVALLGLVAPQMVPPDQVASAHQQILPLSRRCWMRTAPL